MVRSELQGVIDQFAKGEHRTLAGMHCKGFHYKRVSL